MDRTGAQAVSGSFIISLDYELMWGVRDHRSVAEYGDAVIGGRAAIPLMLERFEAHGIRATWATVGLLFARSRDEMLDHAPPPALRPRYADPRLSPYPDLERGVGRNEAEDPWHFGRSLLDRIAQTPGQEIASHTYSHFYCLEPGQTPEAFAADIAAACTIASDAGHRMRSLVFPRNQWTAAHAGIAAAAGLDVHRGTPAGAVYRTRAGAETTLPVRGLRYLDAILPMAGRLDFAAPRRSGPGIDVPASRFLRPRRQGGSAYARLHLARIEREMTRAAREGRCYHLWWHPHNMGRDTGLNLAQLDRILARYRHLRDEYGMESRHMADMAAITPDTALPGPAARPGA